MRVTKAVKPELDRKGKPPVPKPLAKKKESSKVDVI